MFYNKLYNTIAIIKSLRIFYLGIVWVIHWLKFCKHSMFISILTLQIIVLILLLVACFVLLSYKTL